MSRDVNECPNPKAGAFCFPVYVLTKRNPPPAATWFASLVGHVICNSGFPILHPGHTFRQGCHKPMVKLTVMVQFYALLIFKLAYIAVQQQDNKRVFNNCKRKERHI